MFCCKALLLYCTACGGYEAAARAGRRCRASAPRAWWRAWQRDCESDMDSEYRCSRLHQAFDNERCGNADRRTAGTSYNDNTVTNGTKYFYVVAATTLTHESRSAEVARRQRLGSGECDHTVDRRDPPFAIYLRHEFLVGNTNAPALLTLDRAGESWTRTTD